MEGSNKEEQPPLGWQPSRLGVAGGPPLGHGVALRPPHVVDGERQRRLWWLIGYEGITIRCYASHFILLLQADLASSYWWAENSHFLQ